MGNNASKSPSPRQQMAVSQTEIDQEKAARGQTKSLKLSAEEIDTRIFSSINHY